MDKGAIISDNKKYRYLLWRRWDKSKPMVTFMMLNPSTADASQDDPTIRRCVGFAKSWGYGGMYVCNLFAYRATNPKELLTADDPFGDENGWHIALAFQVSEKVVCAWGNRPILNKLMKGQQELDLIQIAEDKLYYIELSKDGTPKHPLYLKKNLEPKKWIPKQ